MRIIDEIMTKMDEMDEEKAKAEEQRQRVIDVVKESISAEKPYCVMDEKLEMLSQAMLHKKGYVSFSKAYRDEALENEDLQMKQWPL